MASLEVSSRSLALIENLIDPLTSPPGADPDPGIPISPVPTPVRLSLSLGFAFIDV